MYFLLDSIVSQGGCFNRSRRLEKRAKRKLL